VVYRYGAVYGILISHPVAAGNRSCGTEGQDKGAQIDSGGQFSTPSWLADPEKPSAL
jgi:hypothetical protein